jgi:hypothetical protein
VGGDRNDVRTIAPSEALGALATHDPRARPPVTKPAAALVCSAGFGGLDDQPRLSREHDPAIRSRVEQQRPGRNNLTAAAHLIGVSRRRQTPDHARPNRCQAADPLRPACRPGVAGTTIPSRTRRPAEPTVPRGGSSFGASGSRAPPIRLPCEIAKLGWYQIAFFECTLDAPRVRDPGSLGAKAKRAFTAAEKSFLQKTSPGGRAADRRPRCLASVRA